MASILIFLALYPHWPATYLQQKVRLSNYTSKVEQDKGQLKKVKRKLWVSLDIMGVLDNVGIFEYFGHYGYYSLWSNS